MKVAIGQIAPVLLDRERTLAKIVDAVAEAGRGGAELVVFGETLLPGYPVWIGRTDGARFAAKDQKEYHSLYLEQAVDIGAGHLAPVQAAAKENGITVCLGVATWGVIKHRERMELCQGQIYPCARGCARGTPCACGGRT